MTEAPWGGQDSRPAENPPPEDGIPGVPAPHGDVYTWYQRGLELLSRGSPAAAAQLLERAAEAARTAIGEYGRTLTASLEGGSDDWALGRERYDELVDLRAFDGLDDDDATEMGFDLDELEPPHIVADEVPVATSTDVRASRALRTVKKRMSMCGSPAVPHRRRTRQSPSRPCLLCHHQDIALCHLIEVAERTCPGVVGFDRRGARLFGRAAVRPFNIVIKRLKNRLRLD